MENGQISDTYHERALQRLERKNAALKRTIMVLLSENVDLDLEDQRETIFQGLDSIGRSDDSDENGGSSDDAEGVDGASGNCLEDPIWDESDITFRCLKCAWEVAEGICQNCCTEYNWDADFVSRIQPSISTHSEALHSDRSRVRRGTTPTREVVPDSIPLEYRSLPEAYTALLARGATRLMCETFHLEYTPKNGIFAWADGDLYTDFAGPGMLKGDFWKIYLGRRVQLEGHDLDGSCYIEGLLEDALLFLSEYWETIEESPGIWVTRPKSIGDMDIESESDYEYSPPPMKRNETSSGPVITVDRYESDVEGDEIQVSASDVEIVDPGLSHHANIADREWPDGSSVADSSDVDTPLLSTAERSSPNSDGSDMCERESDTDSDFSSCEVLSGDEDVLESGRRTNTNE